MLFPTVSDFGVFFPHIKVFNFVPSKVSVFALLLLDFESLEKTFPSPRLTTTFLQCFSHSLSDIFWDQQTFSIKGHVVSSFKFCGIYIYIYLTVLLKCKHHSCDDTKVDLTPDLDI